MTIPHDALDLSVQLPPNWTSDIGPIASDIFWPLGTVQTCSLENTPTALTSGGQRSMNGLQAALSILMECFLV